MTALYILLGLVTAALCVAAAPIGRWLKVVDRPDGQRKVHRGETPLVGGVAIMAPVLIMAIVRGVTTDLAPFYAVIALTIVGFFGLGFIDDRKHIRPVVRLAFAIAVCIVVFEVVPAFEVTFLRFGFLPNAIYLGGAAATGFSLLCIVGLQNAINMADGENGLVMGLALVWSALLYAVAPAHLEPLLLALGIALVVALPFNLSGRLFLGDSGAYALSILLALLAIYSYRTDFAAFPADMVALWFLVPVIDCLRLMLIRALGGRSPMRADRNHLHHRLQRLAPWPGSLAVYLAMVAVPGGLSLAFPTHTPLLALAAVTVYGLVLGLTHRAVRNASTTEVASRS